MTARRTIPEQVSAVLMAVLMVVTCLIAVSCNNKRKKEPDLLKQGAMNTASFGFDKKFLLQNDKSLVELTDDEAAILVSPKYQAKVFTSTTGGDEGRSLGWINYKAFSAKPDPHMNGYGGENRFWLGPEGGKSSVFFAPGDSMVYDNWKTPAPFDTEAWRLVKSDKKTAVLSKDARIRNFLGTYLEMNVLRTVSIQNREQIESALGINIHDSIKYVGYTTQNVLKNTGDEAWNDTTGVPFIWILDMFHVSPSTVIVVPHKAAPKGEKVVTSDYFNSPDKSRLKIENNVVLFKADGKFRSKLGIRPEYALPVAGSYDPARQVLTVTYFSVDSTAQYVNNLWTTAGPDYNGDAMNVYNDGPLADGSQMGPFYEIESVSPGAFLNAGESISHRHDVYHFSGSEKFLDSIATKLLHVDIRTIRRAFRH